MSRRIRTVPPALSALAAAALLATLACGDSSGPSTLTANQMADRFDRIGSDYEREGRVENGAMMHGIAQMVRLTGRLSPVDVTIDGRRSGGWYALGVQETVPELPCPPGAPEWCEPLPPTGARLVVAWQGASADRLLLITADTSGSADFELAFEDPFSMAGAFYLERASEVAWFADSGTVTTAYRRTASPCPDEIDAPGGSQFDCARADFDVTTGFRAEELDFMVEEPAFHRVSLSGRSIAGVLVDVTTWGSPPLADSPLVRGGGFLRTLRR